MFNLRMSEHEFFVLMKLVSIRLCPKLRLMFYVSIKLYLHKVMFSIFIRLYLMSP